MQPFYCILFIFLQMQLWEKTSTPNVSHTAPLPYTNILSECTHLSLWLTFDPEIQFSCIVVACVCFLGSLLLAVCSWARKFFGLCVCVCEYRGLSQLLRQVRVFTVLFKKFPMLVHTGPLSSYPITPNYCRESEVKHLYAPNMLMHAGVCMSVTPVCTSSVAPTQKE